MEETLQTRRDKISDVISANLSCGEWPLLGIKLGLDTVVLMDLQKDANIYNHGRKFTIFRMLEIWQQEVNLSDEEMVRKLKTALCEIGRKDVETKIQFKIQEFDPDSLKKIQEVLRKIFKDLTLPTSVWLDKKRLPLDELFVELTMKNVNQRQEEKHKVISKEELFLETANVNPRRILVEGQPGYGKTTLVAKFLSDWGRGEKYLTDRFDLIFVIYLRYYTGNLRDHLFQHCERVKTSEEHKMRVIESIKERVLLLLDGLDEIPSDVKDTISPLIMGDEYPEMTVVVTCRVGFLQLETKSNQLIKEMKFKSLETESIWGKRVKIEGVSRDKRKEFLQKYLNVNNEKLEEQLSQTNLEVNDLYECPLFLLLLAAFVQEKDIRPIKTKTELYKTIFNFVINRGLERLKGKREYFDVFDLNSESNDVFGCRNLLFNFGRLCLEKFKKQSLIFERSELLTCSNGKGDDEDLIFKLGFLSKQVILFNREEKEHFEPIHKSFLEFTAAFYLSLSDEMEREIQEMVSKWNIWHVENVLLYTFLGGLLHSNAFKMFNAFSASKGRIKIFGYYPPIQEVLLEIPETEENFKSLENLAIGNWIRVKYKKSLHFWLDGLMKTRSENISLYIPENLDIINGVYDDNKVNTIRVSVHKDMTKNMIKILKIIHCQKLNIILEGFSENIPMILKEMSMIKAETVNLTIRWSVFRADFGNLAEHLYDVFYENLKMTVDEKLIESFPEELIEGMGSNVREDVHRVFRENFAYKMCCKIREDFDKDFIHHKKIVKLYPCFGDEIGEKLGKEIYEKFGDKISEISRDMLEDKLFDKFYKELNYIYKDIGEIYCTSFGWEFCDQPNVIVREIRSENLNESRVFSFREWILKKTEDVFEKVVSDKVELNVVRDEDLEIDRKYKLLGKEICIQLGRKKIMVDTLSEKIFCLIAMETVDKFHEELFERIDEDLFMLIKENLDKHLRWLNEAELPFNIYYLSLESVSRNVFTVAAPLIEDLIQKKRIEHGIEIQFAQRNINDSFIKTFNSFVEIVSNSHLKSFGVHSSFLNYRLPFPVTLFNKEKEMQYIGLKGLFEGINVDQMKSVSVVHFKCIGLRLREKNLLPQLISTFRNMEKLTCDCDLINDLGDHASLTEWKQLKTIKHLQLLVDDLKSNHKKESFQNVEKFLNRTCIMYQLNSTNTFKDLENIELYFKFKQREGEFEIPYIFKEEDIEYMELRFQKNPFHEFSIISSRKELRNVFREIYF